MPSAAAMASTTSSVKFGLQQIAVGVGFELDSLNQVPHRVPPRARRPGRNPACGRPRASGDSGDRLVRDEDPTTQHPVAAHALGLHPQRPSGVRPCSTTEKPTISRAPAATVCRRPVMNWQARPRARSRCRNFVLKHYLIPGGRGHLLRMERRPGPQRTGHPGADGERAAADVERPVRQRQRVAEPCAAARAARAWRVWPAAPRRNRSARCAADGSRRRPPLPATAATAASRRKDERVFGRERRSGDARTPRRPSAPPLRPVPARPPEWH